MSVPHKPGAFGYNVTSKLVRGAEQLTASNDIVMAQQPPAVSQAAVSSHKEPGMYGIEEKWERYSRTYVWKQ